MPNDYHGTLVQHRPAATPPPSVSELTPETATVETQKEALCVAGLADKDTVWYQAEEQAEQQPERNSGEGWGEAGDAWAELLASPGGEDAGWLGDCTLLEAAAVDGSVPAIRQEVGEAADELGVAGQRQGETQHAVSSW
mmetsp:Transcript_50928/g.101752  ORF Transcript_50928/g.101752 Transcript_50928/m.101752 type:complete len:139 (-) Transcript_50928:67-483(-)